MFPDTTNRLLPSLPLSQTLRLANRLHLHQLVLQLAASTEELVFGIDRKNSNPSLWMLRHK